MIPGYFGPQCNNILESTLTHQLLLTTESLDFPLFIWS